MMTFCQCQIGDKIKAEDFFGNKVIGVVIQIDNGKIIFQTQSGLILTADTTGAKTVEKISD